MYSLGGLEREEEHDTIKDDWSLEMKWNDLESQLFSSMQQKLQDKPTIITEY